MASRVQDEYGYYDFEPAVDDTNSLRNIQKSSNLAYAALPRSDGNSLTDSSVPLTTCSNYKSITLLRMCIKLFV